MGGQTRFYFCASADLADRAYAGLEAAFEEDGFPLAVVEADEERRLREVSIYAPAGDDAMEARLRALLAELAPGVELRQEALPEIDWVAKSLEGLRPVRAGRFLVHGSHDRDKRRPGQIAIEIEAGLAFGTGHHGTTLGCLRAIDRLAKARRVFRPLDVGTGTGVLAIAAGLRNRVSVLASDIDLVSVIAARENAVPNKARNYVHAIHAAGLKDARFRRGGPYDLVLANILPRPLVGLSTDLCRLVAPGGTVVLSGIIPPHANLVVSAYRAQGLRLVMREEIEGWVTLTMRRGR